jgi:CRISPR/Cas system-associated protein Csm6
MGKVRAAACSRCAKPLVDPQRPCQFCRGERIEAAVLKLVAAAPSSSNAALASRVDAIDTLRCLGFTREQVLLARARAVDGHSAEEILEGLGDGRREALAG